MPWFFFRELPLPNFFDADAEALGDGGDSSGVSGIVAGGLGLGGEGVGSVVFGKRMQVCEINSCFWFPSIGFVFVGFQ